MTQEYQDFHSRIDYWGLVFRDNNVEMYYLRRKSFTRSFSYRALARVCIFFVAAFFFKGGMGEANAFSMYGLMMLSVLLMLIIVIYRLFPSCVRRWSLMLVQSFFLSVSVGKWIYDQMQNSEGVSFQIVLMVILYILCDFSFFRTILINIMLVLLFCFRYYFTPIQSFFPRQTCAIDSSTPIQIFGVSDEPTGRCLMWQYFPFFIGLSLLMFAYGRMQEYILRFQFDLLFSLEKEKNFNTEVLGNMLPPFVVSELTRSQTREDRVMRTVKDCAMVTIVFCDIANFATMVSLMEPLQLVKVLDMQFRKYDRFCQKYRITKIETVAETFLAAGGVETDTDGKEKPPESDSVVADTCVKFALEALASCSSISIGFGRKMRLKIGLNSGRVIAGLIGSRKPQYALFGDTVNTAARMKGSCEEQCIHLSEYTFSLLQEDSTYIFEPKQTLIKGKGMMNTYLLRSTEMQGSSTMEMHVLNTDSFQVPRKRSWGLPRNFMPRFTATETNDDRDENEVDKTYFESLFSGTPSRSDSPSIACTSDMGELEIREKNRMKSISMYFRDAGEEQNFRKRQQAQRENTAYNSQFVLACFVSTTLHVVVHHTILKDVRKTSYASPLLWTQMILLSFLLLLNCFARIGQGQASLVSKLTKLTSAVFVTILLITIFLPLTPAADDQPRVTYTDLLGVLFWLTVTNAHGGGMRWTWLAGFDVCIIVVYTCVVLFGYDYGDERLTSDSRYEFVLMFAELTVLIMIVSRQKEASERLTVCRENDCRVLKEESRVLLNEMLPAQILDELCHNQLRVAYEYADMTLLFGDICGFTDYCKNVPASDVVNLVTVLFSSIDKISRKVRVYKVCTIGDCYVAINEPDQNLCKVLGCSRMLSFADLVLKEILETQAKIGVTTLNMRIGMHLGSFVGGVIGTKSLRFDIWGMDVLICNMVEQGGMPGSIVVSDDLKRFCESHCLSGYAFVHHKDISISESSSNIQRTMETHVLTPCRPDEPYVDHDVEKVLKSSALGFHGKKCLNNARVMLVQSGGVKRSLDAENLLKMSAESAGGSSHLLGME